MNSQWNEKNLNEIYEFSSGLSKSSDEFGFGFPFLSFKTIFYNYYINEDLDELVNSTETEQKTHSIKKGDVFLTRTSETLDELGMSCVALKDYPKATFNGFTKRLRPKNENIIYPLYACYYFRSSLFRKYVDSMAIMTTRASLNNNILSKLPIFFPPYDEQKKISYLLHNLSLKIELNKKINNHLQNQIDILFKSFFINFDFYNGNYKETIFGNIPSEWNLCLFNDVLNERNEKSTNQEIPMFSVTLEGIQPRANIYNKKITAKTTKFKIIHKHDLIFGMPSSGYQYGVMYDEIGGVSSAYPVFEIKGIQPRYVDLFIKHTSNYFNDIVKSGSRMGQGIDKKVLLSKEIYIPPKEYLDKYYAIESNLVCMVNHNLNEINNLSKLRDTLLPKLMSGEIDVSKINYDLE